MIKAVEGAPSAGSTKDGTEEMSERNVFLQNERAP
jgi:hypothetical protein